MVRDEFAHLHAKFDDRYTDEEWAAEIARRLGELDSGTAETISWEEAMQRIKEAGEQALRLNRNQV
jgi:putative addiction module component (TIGR02574 family)